jgi:hypothetical protein
MPFDVSTIFKIIEESILPNIFQNDFSSIDGVAPPKQPQPHPFQPQSCQRGPKAFYCSVMHVDVVCIANLVHVCLPYSCTISLDVLLMDVDDV